MTDKTSSEIDNIWITSKTRILSEVRYKKYSFYSHIIFSYYSFLLIITSIFSDQLSLKIQFFSQLNISISVALFASSLIVYGFRFDEIASKHRNCYLRLNSMLSNKINDDEMLKKYHEILEFFPNHASKDYDNFLFQNWWKNRSIWNSNGKIQPSWKQIIIHIIRQIMFYITMSSLMAIPTLIILLPFAL